MFEGFKHEYLRRGFMLNDNFADRVNGFWFGDIGENGLCSPAKSARWFSKDSDFDRLVGDKFGDFPPLVYGLELDGMIKDPHSALALIILTDQFPRNIHRGLPESFAFDGIALAICQKGMDRGLDSSLLPIERVFFYMPLMHSEDISVQKLSVRTFSFLAEEFREFPELFEILKNSTDFARRHFEIIKRFGRYPHRNKILGRDSTPEEVEFLKQPGSGF